MLCCIPKILKNESNSQPLTIIRDYTNCCVVSQRYSKMKAIHNPQPIGKASERVVLYPKDTQKWKQFTTLFKADFQITMLCCIPKILKNESNSQLSCATPLLSMRCVVSQRYSKMKAIHNIYHNGVDNDYVVLYPKDTQKWKQFTTWSSNPSLSFRLCCIPKILKNESNSQHVT